MAAKEFGGFKQVEVDGLREVRNYFKKVDVGFGETLKEFHRDIAKELAAKVRSRAMAHSNIGRKVAPSIKGVGTKTSAGIRLGTGSFTNTHSRAPQQYKMAQIAIGAEFGSDRYRQFGDWKGNGMTAGNFLYPTLREQKDWIADEAQKRIERLTEIFGA